MPFARIEDAVAAYARGEILVVVDDEDRENEGDLIMAAEFATPEKVAFFLHHTSGYLCAPITAERAQELDLPLMVQSNTESQRTAFLVTVDYRHGTTTGISSHDRCATIKALCDPGTRPGDLARPGHINPLLSREGGVLKRAGHTEATIDLCRLAGLYPAGLLCEIVDEDKRDMARVPELERFAEEHGLLMISIADLIRYRRQNEKLVRRIAEARIPTTWGDFTAYAYESLLDGEQHLALVKGTVSGEDDVLVRVHSECLTGDVFGSLRCDCGVQLDSAMQLIADEGRGVRRLPQGPRGPRDRHRAQDPGLQPPGAGSRHGRRQPRARPARRQPRVRHRRPDPRRPRRHHDADRHQQPDEVRRPGGLRARHHRAGAHGGRPQPGEHRLPAHEAGEDGPPARGPRRPGGRPGHDRTRRSGPMTAGDRGRPHRRASTARGCASVSSGPGGTRPSSTAWPPASGVAWPASASGRRDVVDVTVPGSFELPMGARILAASGQVDAVICLGCVIRGETTHYELVAGESAGGIQQVQLSTGVPVAFGVLTTEDEAQALARSEGPGGHNVGEDAAVVAVEMARLAQRFPA